MMGYAPITHLLLGGEFMKSRSYCVYKHTCPNGKVYIGLTGKLLNVYSSIMEASRMTGANDSAIIRVCKGKQRTSLGFVWKYL